MLKGGTKLLKGGTKLLKGGTKLLKGGTKLLKGGTKSLGWATGGGSYDPPDPPPPWLRACANIGGGRHSVLPPVTAERQTYCSPVYLSNGHLAGLTLWSPRVNR